MLGRAIVLSILLVAAAGLVARAERPEPAPLRTTFASFPLTLGEWKGSAAAPLEDNVLKVLRVTDYLTRVYYAPDRAGVGLYVGYWGSQRQGDTMHSPLNCLPGSGWEPLSKSALRVTVGSPTAAGGSTDIEINRYVIQKGLDRQLVLYWYQSHGRVVASEYWGKFYLIRDAMALNRTDGSLVRITTPIGEDGETRAEQAAVRFVKVLFPNLNAFLPA